MHVSVQKSTRTTWPRSSAGRRGSELSHSVAPPSDGMCTDPRVSGGSGAEVLDLRHVAPGGRGRLLRSAPALPSVHVGRVPVPPIVWRGCLFERVVMLGRLVQQIGQGGDVHVSSPIPGRGTGW